MKLLFALVPAALTALAVCFSVQAAEPRVRIYGEVPFADAGNFAEFEATMKRTGDEARAELLDEFGSLLLPSVMSGADAASAAKAFLQVIVTLDRLRDEHVLRARDGIPLALESQFLAAFEAQFREQGLAEGERRAELVRPGELPGSIDFVLYGSYTVIAGGNVILTLTAQELRTGELHSFEAQGSLAEAVGALAQQLFDFVQANPRTPWKNPQAGLEWLQPPPYLARTQLPREAELYCEGQDARLPYARELVLAAQGGNFRSGGIPSIGEDDVFLVADHQRGSERIYYFGTALTGNDPRGPVRDAAGFGEVRASFVCVRGDASASVRWEQDLYRAYRQAGRLAPAAAVPVQNAIEYLLFRLDAYGASGRFASRYRSADEAIAVLESKGFLLSAALKAKLAALDD